MHIRLGKRVHPRVNTARCVYKPACLGRLLRAPAESGPSPGQLDPNPLLNQSAGPSEEAWPLDAAGARPGG
ncbi:hypothetical protein NDU88_009545 [Pleurodeles waltl]|uniref:Uncharacterized protein n=1 Tax=Pleurodeles waltl TaxID=8319 RepID=A0AAV7PSS7_PLEWA|nr:hypothetical protein NDU88_009545 [Pleurodeles waltl]